MDEPLFNTNFADQREIPQEKQDVMQGIYKLLHEILEKPKEHCETPTEAVEAIQALETTLQLFWKFPLDKAFHSYWVSLKGCNCPEVDNWERSGSGVFAITNGCPYHGFDKAKTWEDGRFKV